MEEIKTVNALIESADIDNERGLSAWLHLTFQSGGQGFGGYILYAPSGWAANRDKSNYAGHFIYRVLEIAGVERWSQLAGKTIRIKHTWSKVHAIGHIIKEDWFEPSEDFKKLTEST